MTKPNLTSINVIIDQSDSMHNLANDTIGGFNSFLADQKALTGEAVLTLCTFNTDYRLVHDFVHLSGIPDLSSKSYAPSGGTALLDAMGTTITEVGKKLAAMKEEDRPSKVIFLIITDGQENSSKTYRKQQIADMVKHQQDTYSWEFVFMGANIDAMAEGSSLGISTRNTMNYAPTAAGTKSLYRSISENMSSYRSSGSSRANFFDQSGSTPPATTTTTTTTVVSPVVPPTTKTK
jgi:hypothetical protein